jgi:hypothetical protein
MLLLLWPQGKPLNLALALVKSGLARLQPTVDPHRLPGGAELLEAQKNAKAAKLKVRLAEGVLLPALVQEMGPH